MKSRENIYYLFWIFIIGCVVGWCIEGVFSLIKWKEFINHSAVVIGPFNVAYGLGALVLSALLFKFKDDKNWKIFLIGFIGGAILEYTMSLGMELVLGFTAWDYSRKPFNINGRICLGTLIPFGIFGLLVIYILNPFFLGKISLLTDTWLKILFYVSLSIFVVDNIVSGIVIGYVKKTEKAFTPEVDNTEEMTAKVKEVLQNKSPLHRRLLNAYPKLQAVKVKIKEKKEQIKEQIVEQKKGIEDKAKEVEKRVENKTKKVEEKVKKLKDNKIE